MEIIHAFLFHFKFMIHNLPYIIWNNINITHIESRKSTLYYNTDKERILQTEYKVKVEV